jgi:uncharacterized membrane protein
MWKLLVGAEGIVLVLAVGNVGVPFRTIPQFLVYEFAYLIAAIACGAFSIYLRVRNGRGDIYRSFKGFVGSAQSIVFLGGIAGILAMIGLYSI